MSINKQPISNPPKSYLDIILPLINKSREMLEKGEELMALAFVGNLTTQQVIAVLIDNESDESKDKSVSAIRKTAIHIDADFIFMVAEAWSLRPDKLNRYQEIVDKYGSIGASPYALDVCSFRIETRHGMWIAEPQIKPKGISKKKRTIGEVQFRFFDALEGTFSHLLPDKGEPSSTLH